MARSQIISELFDHYLGGLFGDESEMVGENGRNAVLPTEPCGPAATTLMRCHVRDCGPGALPRRQRVTRN